MKELARIVTPDGGSIILYDWMEVKDGRNLVRLDANGRLVWRAEPYIPPNDCFVRIWWKGERLFAQTWSAFEVTVDASNGVLTALKFAK